MEDTSKDPVYRAYVRREIEAGLRDSEAGRTVSVEEVRARFGLSGPDSEGEIAKAKDDRAPSQRISRGDTG